MGKPRKDNWKDNVNKTCLVCIKRKLEKQEFCDEYQKRNIERDCYNYRLIKSEYGKETHGRLEDD